MSTAYIQAKLRDAGYVDRFSSANPENNLDYIDLIKSLEICYFRGLIDKEQIIMITWFVQELEVTEPEELAAALRAVAEISGYTDDLYLKMIEELNTDGTAQTKLDQLSSSFTIDLLKKDTNGNELAE